MTEQFVDRSHAPLSNYTEWPDSTPDLAVAQDPFSTSSDRAVHGRARYMTPEEFDAWSSAADRYTGPRVIECEGSKWLPDPSPQSTALGVTANTEE